MAKEKKKAADATDAVRTAAKQAAGVHVERTKAEGRFDAEMRAASGSEGTEEKYSMR